MQYKLFNDAKIEGIEDEVYTFQHKEEIIAQAIVKYISKEK